MAETERCCCAAQQNLSSDGSSGSFAPIDTSPAFTACLLRPEADKRADVSLSPLSAKSGHPCQIKLLMQADTFDYPRRSQRWITWPFRSPARSCKLDESTLYSSEAW